MGRRTAAMRVCFAAIPDWRVDALGAYFAYVRHPFAGTDAWKVVAHLALDHGVLLLPATAFAGSGHHVRISMAFQFRGLGELHKPARPCFRHDSTT
jgi:aspartate/methionine/tyrosine aminotransferase